MQYTKNDCGDIMLKTLNSFDLKNKRILIRVDFNVPLDGEKVVDNFRIKSVLPTIKTCLTGGASVVLMSHLGRPKGVKNSALSLMPVGEELAELLEMQIKFSHDCISEDARDVSFGLKAGEIHLLENLRFHKGETDNDVTFSAKLAKHGEIYINDAFGTAHRAHASNVGVTSFFNRKGIGILMEKEVRYLQSAIAKPKRPLVLILGGAKISGKLELIDKFLDEADSIIIGGGMAYTFLKSRGRDIGNSLLDESMLVIAKDIVSRARAKQVTLVFPSDVVIAENMDDASNRSIIRINEIPTDKMGLDIGPETVEKFSDIIQSAGTIVWNGPMGVFEVPGFEYGTKEVAESMAIAKEKGATVIVGGGDTAAAVEKFGLTKQMSHVSTGGGASLELLSGKSLPALSKME